MNLHVEIKPGTTAGLLICGYMKFPCTVSGSAVTVGTFTMKEVYWRADRVAQPATGLPTRQIEATGDLAALWRDDHACDLAAGISQSSGISLYMHAKSNNEAQVLDGITVDLDDLRTVLKQVNPGSRLTIANESEFRI